MAAKVPAPAVSDWSEESFQTGEGDACQCSRPEPEGLGGCPCDWRMGSNGNDGTAGAIKQIRKYILSFSLPEKSVTDMEKQKTRINLWYWSCQYECMKR